MDKLLEMVSEEFVVEYTCKSTVRFGFEESDIKAFLEESPESKDLPDDEFKEAFLKWCITEDDFDYETRGDIKLTSIVLESDL